MIYVLSAVSFLLFILYMIQSFKIRRILNALAKTNASLNETRQLVADHNKNIKKLLQFIEKR